jgi:hypothetical protein
VAALREKKPGVWEVRIFTGTDARGRPTQISRTVRGGKRDAQRLAASLEVGPGSASAAGRDVADVLDAWIDQNLDTWASSSARDQQSRVRSIKQDKIAKISIAQLSISDVERWHTRLRRAGLQDAGIRNQHGALSAALNQAVRWGWASQNVASLAQRKTSKKPPKGVMSLDDVRNPQHRRRSVPVVDNRSHVRHSTSRQGTLAIARNLPHARFRKSPMRSARSAICTFRS